MAALDAFVYALAAFLGNVGVAVTGFGMAIVFLFVWQICILLGYEGDDVKYAVFIQTLALAAALPFLMYEAKIREHATRALLLPFIPVTIISTPLGNFASESANVDTVRMVAGIVVSVVAVWELYRNRTLICSFCCPTGSSRVQDNINANPMPKQSRPNVYFMVGSQRSGSNWLRVMINQSKVIAGPHPPHILKCFKPLLHKYGDLQISTNYEILVDHVCAFVERNPVTWVDISGKPIIFDRADVFRRCEDSVAETSSKKRTLVAIFDALMNVFTERNGKHTWICKSMGYAKFHAELLEHYGPSLRYVYLHRDPRDVAMSFSAAVVGDSHYYSIIMAWRELQSHCLRILQETVGRRPKMMHVVTYEQLLQDQKWYMKILFDFLEAPFPEEEVMHANKSTEAIFSASKSSLWSNLTRNPAEEQGFRQAQLQKWRHPETGMSLTDIRLVESLVHDIMKQMGYKLHSINEAEPPEQYSEEQVAEFKRLNAEGVELKKSKLAAEDPTDLERRLHQEAVLSFPVFCDVNRGGRLPPLGSENDIVVDNTTPGRRPEPLPPGKVPVAIVVEQAAAAASGGMEESAGGVGGDSN